MKKNSTIPMLIFSIIATLVSIGVFVFFFKVIENKNRHTSVVLTTLEGKMKEKEDAILFAQKVAEIKSLQEEINGHFVDPNKIDTFVNYLEGIGTDLGSQLLVKNIDIPPKTNNTILFSLSIIGTFKNVMKTITYLENIPYKITISEVYLNKNGEQNSGAQEVNGKNKAVNITTWQANVSFSILSLNKL